MRKMIVTTILLLILIGCGLKPAPVKYFIVQRDVPISPTFVVLPFNDLQSQILCAEQAEAALIAAGVKVVMPPPTKYVETKKGIEGEQTKLGQGSDRVQHTKGKGDSVSLEAAQAFETRLERYSEYGEINADYIVTTNGTIYYSGGPYIQNISVRIFKKDSKEVLSSFVTYTDYIKDDMYKSLEALGIRVKQKP